MGRINRGAEENNHQQGRFFFLAYNFYSTFSWKALNIRVLGNHFCFQQ